MGVSLTPGQWPADLSPDGRYTWTGNAWKPNPLSPDGVYFWYRDEWHLLPPGPVTRLAQLDFEQAGGPGLTWTTANFWSDRGSFVLLWQEVAVATLEGPWTSLTGQRSASWTGRTAAEEWTIETEVDFRSDSASFVGAAGVVGNYQGQRVGYDGTIAIDAISYKISFDQSGTWSGGAAHLIVQSGDAEVIRFSGRVEHKQLAYDVALHPERVEAAHIPILLLAAEFHAALRRSRQGNRWALPHSPSHR